MQDTCLKAQSNLIFQNSNYFQINQINWLIEFYDSKFIHNFFYLNFFSRYLYQNLNGKWNKI